MTSKVVLAHSGGLDTSAATDWLADKHNMDATALTADIGGVGNLPAIWQEALKTGVVKVLTLDARKMVGLCERLARAEVSKLFHTFSDQ